MSLGTVVAPTVPGPSSLTSSAALRLVISFGAFSLVADMTHKVTRLIVRPYLALLGASGTGVPGADDSC